jgi:adenosylmethionine-8-amino-7-oxononanoate aminotransferase
VSKIRHKGLLVGIDLVDGKKGSLNFVKGIPISHYIIRESLKKGVYLRTLGNTLTIIPPLATPANQLDEIMDKCYEILDRLEKRIKK